MDNIYSVNNEFITANCADTALADFMRQHDYRVEINSVSIVARGLEKISWNEFNLTEIAADWYDEFYCSDEYQDYV